MLRIEVGVWDGDGTARLAAHYMYLQKKMEPDDLECQSEGVPGPPTPAVCCFQGAKGRIVEMERLGSAVVEITI